jgi:hypothetical protein
MFRQQEWLTVEGLKETYTMAVVKFLLNRVNRHADHYAWRPAYRG